MVITLEHPSFVVHRTKEILPELVAYTLEHCRTGEFFSVSVEVNENTISISQYAEWGEEKPLSNHCFRSYIWFELRKAVCESLSSHPTYRLPIVTGEYKFTFPYDIVAYYIADPPYSFWNLCKLNFMDSHPMEKILMVFPFFLYAILLVGMIIHNPSPLRVIVGFIFAFSLQAKGWSWVAVNAYKDWRKIVQHSNRREQGGNNHV